MNITFTPHELLHTFEALTKNQMIFPEDDIMLLNKFRTAILVALNKIHEENVSTSFQTWEETQSKKIKDLEKKNEEILNVISRPISQDS